MVHRLPLTGNHKGISRPGSSVRLTFKIPHTCLDTTLEHLFVEAVML